VEEKRPQVIEVATPIMLKELAQKIGIKPNAIISHLMDKGILANINQNLGEDIVKGVLAAFGLEYKKSVSQAEVVPKEEREAEEKAEPAGLLPRAPVVTFMGHVDHGKTSLLDFIRKTRVADKEKGGITQHIGAYKVKFKKGSVTFLDTPGHEAFTAMRARGANATDVVVLVVAADDGVMPQTREAIDHARAAGVPIVVAINKCDLPAANVEKVKGQLSQIGLTPEDWGGKTIAVSVSAKTGEGVDALLEMLLLEAELLELKASPKIRARGVVIEGKLSSEQGPVATVLVKNGTLHAGDVVVSGMHCGKVKAMFTDRFERVDEALPSAPVSILGLSGVPMAGEEFFVVKDEKKARTLCLLKQDAERERKLKLSKRVTLEDFYKRAQDGEVKELRMILKGDVQGSIEALQRSLEQLSTKEVKLNIIHSGGGNINESDVMLAVASGSVIIGFNVKIDPEAEEATRKEEVDVKLYGIIYEAIADVQAAMEGLLEPVSKEVFIGRAQVRQVFRVSKVGTIAGSYVVKGKIVRTGIARLIRDKEVVYEGKIASLKRFKDDAREVAEDFECGIGLDRHDDIKEGDLIEVYQIEKVARRLTK
jgi:translation initiation factor IF-2